MTKNITILGSTGSVGTTALKVVRHLKGELCVKALAAKSNIDALEIQAKEFHPEVIAVFDPQKAQELKRRLPHVRVVAGMEGLEEVASLDSIELVLSAMTGASGILPTVAAVLKGKTIAIANKEVLVAAGEYIMRLAKTTGSRFIPVDSEHSALFQCLQGEDLRTVSRLVLTASGGPFRTFSAESLMHVEPEDATKHPNWQMGSKVTIDCSTLMNKGLEVIEAHWLFGVDIERIDVVIHPQSVIHSLVEFVDGSVMAQLAPHDMVLPVQYALTYPHRQRGVLPPFDFQKYSKLEFFSPDTQKFRCLSLAYHALREGKSLPCYMNAANEILVERFLNKEIAWVYISEALEKLMSSHQPVELSTLDDIMHVDALARQEALRS